MADTTMSFTDGAAYERFMGRWSRTVGRVFLDWIAPPRDAHWLDIGCGTGAFTGLILDTCAPASVAAVDPSPDQIAYARGLPVGARADFRVADAQALPFADASFDVVASALVINFIPDRPRGLAEMRRVARPGGIVAGYVWDFAGRRSPNTPMGLAARQHVEVMRAPGTADSTLERMHGLFAEAGFGSVESRAIDVVEEFPDFEDYWQSQTPSFGPLTQAIMQLPAERIGAIKDTVRAMFPPQPDGSIAVPATAHAVKAIAP